MVVKPVHELYMNCGGLVCSRGGTAPLKTEENGDGEGGAQSGGGNNNSNRTTNNSNKSNITLQW